MVRYIIRRLLWAIVTLIIVSFVTFLIFYVLPPGDPAVLRAGHFPNPQLLVHIRHALGVDKPVIPGIMPVLSLAAIKRMSEMQGSEFPAWLAAELNAVGDDPAAVRRIGIEEATKLCRRLLDGGAPGLHFYTLNRSTATREIYANLGLQPAS